MCVLLFDLLKLNEGMQTFYGIHDLGQIGWIGDTAQQITQFRDRWLRIIENLDPAIQLDRDLLRNTLHRQMQLSKNISILTDIAHYARDPSAKTYEFLLQALDRYVDAQTLEYNWRMQENEYKQGGQVQASAKKNDKQDKGETTQQTKDPNAAVSKGGGKGSSSQAPSSKGPCWFYHKDKCTKGKDCKYSHARLSKEETDRLVKPEPRGRSPSREPRPTDRSGKGRGSSPQLDDKRQQRGRSSSPPQKNRGDEATKPSENKYMCMDFLAMGKCQRGADCKYQHLTAERYAQKRERKVAKSASKAVAKAAAASAQVCVPFISTETSVNCALRGLAVARSVLSGGDPATTAKAKLVKYASCYKHVRWNMRAVQMHDVVPRYAESLEYPVHRRTQREFNERVVRTYQSLVERVTQPDFWYVHKGYLVRAHSILRDSLFLPDVETLQSSQHIVPYGILLSDFSPMRYTVMLQWKNGAITGKTRLVRDQWLSRYSRTVDCFEHWIGITKFRLVDPPVPFRRGSVPSEVWSILTASELRRNVLLEEGLEDDTQLPVYIEEDTIYIS